MKAYFANFPKIDFQGQKLRNIMLSVRVETPQVLTSGLALLPYTLRDGDTPTTLAFDYYGSIDYVWLVLLSNNIIDPYSQWFKHQKLFNDSIIDVYGSLYFAMNQIHHYVDPDGDPVLTPPVSVATYNDLDTQTQGRMLPVSIYDWEDSINESKRTVFLVEKGQAPKLALQLEKSLLAPSQL